MLLASCALAAELHDRVRPGATIAWAGLDYSPVEMFVPETFRDPAEKIFWGPGGGLRDRIATYAGPGAAWTQLVDDWNAMFVGDTLRRFEKATAIDLVPELPEPDGQTQPRAADWFRPEVAAGQYPATVDAAAVAARVATWTLAAKDGTALGVLVDRISMQEDRLCAWPVYIDVASREVLWTERVCAHPVGIGFRNYWYNPINDVMERVTRHTRLHAR